MKVLKKNAQMKINKEYPSKKISKRLLLSSLRKTLDKLNKLGKIFPPEIFQSSFENDFSRKLESMITSSLNFTITEQQELLEQQNDIKRLQTLYKKSSSEVFLREKTQYP